MCGTLFFKRAFVREFAQVGRAVSEPGLVFILDSVVVSVRSPGTMRNAYQDQGSTLGNESRYHSLERGKNSREDSPGSQTTGKCPCKLLHQPEPGYEEERTRSVLFGRSQRRYGHVTTHLAETFRFRASTVGRVFIQEIAKALDPFMNLMTRSL